MNTKISNLSKVFSIVTSILLAISIFVPIWRIELDAPQYPEGLMMTIHANKLGGQVEIINGLNHYIGMATLHKENFFEFTILPYIIGFFSLLFFITGIVGNKKLLYVSFGLLIVFGIASMIDFYRWNYNYGHNLDPTAAIVVPGMSYQPPLIGYKQLLNFGAYSIPDIGGWLFIIGGILMAIAFQIESKFLNIIFKNKIKTSIVILSVLFLQACTDTKPQVIKVNKDICDFCAMTISDGRFGAEVITEKGRAYKFDDIQCLMGYKRENTKVGFAAFYVHDYSQKNSLIDATKAFYIKHDDMRSPMGGNIAAFKNKTNAEEFTKKHQVEIKKWTDINLND